MNTDLFSLAFMGLSGGVGGALNALTTDNGLWWPSWVSGEGTGRVVRLGLVTSVMVGAGAAGLVGVLAPFSAQPSTASIYITAALVGWLACRCLTSETDKRLLRAALCKACVAPAAHPDTARLMAAATPFSAYQTSCNLAPSVRWRDPSRDSRVGPDRGESTGVDQGGIGW